MQLIYIFASLGKLSMQYFTIIRSFKRCRFIYLGHVSPPHSEDFYISASWTFHEKFLSRVCQTRAMDIRL